MNGIEKKSAMRGSPDSEKDLSEKSSLPVQGRVRRTDRPLSVEGYNRKCYEGGRCLECGDELPYGRADMKYCSVKCKSHHNYVNARHLENLKASVGRSLSRNHDILESLIEQGIKTIDIPDLVGLGYKLDCVTSYHKVRSHNELRCYDIKYFMTEGRIFGISKVPLISKKRRPDDE